MTVVQWRVWAGPPDPSLVEPAAGTLLPIFGVERLSGTLQLGYCSLSLLLSDV